MVYNQKNTHRNTSTQKLEAACSFETMDAIRRLHGATLNLEDGESTVLLNVRIQPDDYTAHPFNPEDGGSMFLPNVAMQP
jgi:hypothetical protein